MDMGFLLVSSLLWSLFSISYSFPITLWQFANNILVGLYQKRGRRPKKPPLSEVFKLNASKLNVRNCLESMEKQVLSGTDVLLAKLPSLKSSADRVNASDNERA
jgi:hypothetical protein